VQSVTSVMILSLTEVGEGIKLQF